jgi:hypothetical protein
MHLLLCCQGYYTKYIYRYCVIFDIQLLNVFITIKGKYIESSLTHYEVKNVDIWRNIL